MLPLLDLHGIPRLDFHTSVMEALRETLIKKINEIGLKQEGKLKDKKLKELLSKSFPVIKIKSLRPVVSKYKNRLFSTMLFFCVMRWF